MRAPKFNLAYAAATALLLTSAAWVRDAAYGQNGRKGDRSLTPSEVADLAASFQQAVVDVLVARCDQALRRTGHRTLSVGGGVAANQALREALERRLRPRGIRILFPTRPLCTDNAAMAAVAAERFRQGDFDPLDLDAVAGLVRTAAG